jgi:dihydroorotate dehydrogenase electron transfer subunit
MTDRPQRNTIVVEDAEVLSQDAHDGEQYVLRLRAPKVAARAEPGSFAHIQCDQALPMRRPFSIMRVEARQGWVDLLYKVVGTGTRLLAARQPGDRISILGPIGNPFRVPADRRRPLLIGGGVGIPPMVFLADRLRSRRQEGFSPFVVMGSEVPFPFQARPSRTMVPGMPDGTIACMPLLEDWGIANRLASLQGYPGCHQGYVTDLARRWLDALDTTQRDQVGLFACGPHPMLEAVAQLAAEYDLPCQVCLEEFMACAVGGCAGCTVEVQTPAGPAMKRVCVDGPVFDARTVFPAVA